MTWFRQRPFVWLLAALLGLLVLVPADSQAVGGRLLSGVLVTAAYLAGFAVVFKARRQRAVALLTGIPALATTWVGHFPIEFPRIPLAVTTHTASILFLGLTTAVILTAVLRLRAVTTDAVAGALCGYLLVGVFFGHGYSLVEALAPGSFRGGDFATGPPDPGQVQLTLTYFSFVTLTTVGYGDVTPVTGLARGLANAEAIVGQFYLAVLVADLIGKRVAQALSEGATRPPLAQGG
jgi:hypothetical protein